MPGLDGYAVTERIRGHENPAVRDIPIIALTADYTPEVQERLARCGINDLVLKPFTPEELSAVLLRSLSFPQRAADSENNGRIQELEPYIALDRLWEDCNRDWDIMQEVLRLFQNGILEFLGALGIHSKTADYLEIRAAAHKVKAGLKLIEARTWLDQVEKIQDLARDEKGAALIRGYLEKRAAEMK